MNESLDNTGARPDELKVATERHDQFFKLVANVKTAADFALIKQQIDGIVAAAEYEVNEILQEAGKIPDGDPRHEQFEKGNQILAEYERISQLP